ncbi:MAG TPA: uroporphyrinogen decarboxylase [Chloroflexota bacterium]|jgi:uroporphyrinogen decarboxylase|nr:uroporphyrinogen decarboxylase [Chloroflexota bacterium]
MPGEARLLAACRREAVDCTPVWFMRQAGRCLAEYRQLRQRYDILTLAKTPELCTAVTLMPVERFGVDGAVMFADIMLPLEAMGVSFEIQPEVGPIVHQPIRSAADVARLRVVDGEEATPYVMEAIRLIKRELSAGSNTPGAGKAALIGFSGAPFTLACYMIEGRPSRDYARAKGLMYSDPQTWHAFMDKVTEMVVRYLRAQIAAGVQVVQLFDSWVGTLSPQDYEEYSWPYSRRVFQALRETGVPRIHFGTGAASLLELMAGAGPDLVSVDWRVPLDQAWERIGYDKGIQGNLDPVLALAPWERLERGMHDVLRRAGGRPGHIFNLGHGVLPETDPEQLARLVQAVHQATARQEVSA